MTATIREVQIDPEFRGVIPVHSWDELADLQASIERFGYLAPFIDAVADGKLPPTTVADINAGKLSIHGVAKSLKATDGKPTKSKSSGWQAAVKAFTTLVRRIIKRDPQRRYEIAVELRRLGDEFEDVATAAD